MNESLTKEERLRKSRDIGQVFTQGKKRSIPGISVYWVKNGFSRNRMAVTLPRKFGNSVERNRTKRWIREIYRKMKGKLYQGYDIVLLVYPGSYRFFHRQQQINSLLKKTPLLSDAYRIDEHNSGAI